MSKSGGLMPSMKGLQKMNKGFWEEILSFSWICETCIDQEIGKNIER